MRSTTGDYIVQSSRDHRVARISEENLYLEKIVSSAGK